MSFKITIVNLGKGKGQLIKAKEGDKDSRKI